MRYLLLALIAAVAFVLPASASAGTFLVGCNHDQIGFIDPIVAPGMASHHEHDLAGSKGINPFSTFDSMQDAGTTCDLPGDTAGYWFPSYIKNGVTIPSPGPSVYYLNPDNSKRQPFPAGLKQVQGDPENHSTAKYAATYGCGTSTTRVTIPTSCAPGQGFRTSIYFDACWNGKELDNALHKTLGACGTPGFKVKVPQLQIFIDMPASAVGSHLSCETEADPPGTCMHADFWNTWDQFVLSDVVRFCVNKATAQCRVDVDRRAVVDTNETGRPVVFTF